MNEILNQIRLHGIIPVVKIEDAENAIPLAEALCAGGLPTAEITFRTDCAAEAIRKIASKFPDMLIGAGTVLTCGQADDAAAAGAKFIVTPGFNPKVIQHCADINIPVIPGCATPSELDCAVAAGLSAVKFFPAEAAGGLEMIKAMSAPYSEIKFMPTGGISEKNLAEYLSCRAVLACGGSWMVKEEFIKDGNFQKITELTHNAVLTMHGFGLKHIGVNASDEIEAVKSAESMLKMFGFAARDAGGAVFSGELFEFLKHKFHGTKGHIGISANNLERAVAYLKRMGYEFIDEEFKFNEKGEQTNAAYLKEEFFGFAIHLISR